MVSRFRSPRLDGFWYPSAPLGPFPALDWVRALPGSPLLGCPPWFSLVLRSPIHQQDSPLTRAVKAPWLPSLPLPSD